MSCYNNQPESVKRQPPCTVSSLGSTDSILFEGAVFLAMIIYLIYLIRIDFDDNTSRALI